MPDIPINEFVVPVVEAVPDEPYARITRFRDTSCMIGARGAVLTAEHVVRTPADELAIATPNPEGGFRLWSLQTVEAHPTEDVAVGIAALGDSVPASPLRITTDPQYGSASWMLWGYPEDVMRDRIVGGVAVECPELVFVNWLHQATHAARRRRSASARQRAVRMWWTRRARVFRSAGDPYRSSQRGRLASHRRVRRRADRRRARDVRVLRRPPRRSRRLDPGSARENATSRERIVTSEGPWFAPTLPALAQSRGQANQPALTEAADAYAHARSAGPRLQPAFGEFTGMA